MVKVKYTFWVLFMALLALTACGRQASVLLGPLVELLTERSAG